MAPWYIFDELIMPNEQRGEINGRHENYNEIREAITDGVDGEQGSVENSETVVSTVSLLTTMTLTTTTTGARVVTTVTSSGLYDMGSPIPLTWAHQLWQQPIIEYFVERQLS